MRQYCKEHFKLAFATCPFCKNEDTQWGSVLFCQNHENLKCETCTDFKEVESWNCSCGGNFSYGGKYPQEQVEKEKCCVCYCNKPNDDHPVLISNKL